MLKTAEDPDRGIEPSLQIMGALTNPLYHSGTPAACYS